MSDSHLLEVCTYSVLRRVLITAEYSRNNKQRRLAHSKDLLVEVGRMEWQLVS